MLYRMLLIPLCYSGSVLAAAADSSTSTTAVSDSTAAIDPLSAGYLLQLTLSLLLVLAAIFALAWLLRRGRLGLSPSSGLIRVLETQALGPRERIMLLQVGQEQVLIGVVPGQIRALHTLSQNVEVPENATAVSASFASRLQKMMEKQA